MGFAHRIYFLWLTVSSLALAAPTVPHEHVVQSGQTLAKIAKRYHVELDALCAVNDLRKSAKLQPGLRLTIPSEDDPVDRAASTTSQVGRSSTAKKPPESARRPGAPMTSYSQYLARPAKRGWVHIMGHHGDWQGQLVGKNGKLQPKAVGSLSRLLAWPRTDFVMDRRLLTLLSQVSDAFGGRTLRVVSGYRTTSYASESKHPLGRACDFHVLGVPNTALRDFVKTLDNVGVGFYPNSTFIHLDSRDHDAYWIDYAGPGEPPRSTPHRVARTTDAPSLTAERAAASMKGEDATGANPEAEADADSRRDEVRESKSEVPAPPVAAPPKRLVRSAPQRSVTSPNPVADPEATDEIQRDASPAQVDL
jgi:uncharacterized protein YcbK (DUF882 family)